MKVPYLIECPLNGSVPTSVSLVANRCDHAENNLKILNLLPDDGVKKRFGVCSKQAIFEDRTFTMRFIEWVHTMKILGAEKIHFFYEYLHPDMFEVVEYFEGKGIVEAWQYLDPSGIRDSVRSSEQTTLLEKNMLTDCFHRVRNLYDYIAVLDFDEVIMPRFEEDRNWEDILRRVNSSEYIDSYTFANVFYPEVGAAPLKEIPEYLYMLQHVQRTQKYSQQGNYPKSILGTERVLSVHNHMPQRCLSDNEKCNIFYVPNYIAQNSHYRNARGGPGFDILVDDKSIWKFKDQLLRAVSETIQDTHFDL